MTVLLMPLILVFAIAATIARLTGARSVLSSTYPAVAQVHRRLLGSRIAGLALGLIAAIGMVWTVYHYTPDEQNGFVAMVGGPMLFSAVYLACLLISERFAYRPAGNQRSAGLRRRNLREYVPRSTAVLVVVVTVATLAVFAGQFAVVSPTGYVKITCANDSGVRWVAHSSTDRGEVIAFTAGGVVVGLLALAVVIAAVRRARPETDIIASAEDDGLRRNSIRVASGIYAALTTIVGAVITLSLAEALTNDFSPCSAPSWWAPLGTALMWSLIGWLALFVWSVSQIVARPQGTRKTASIG